MTVIYSLVFGVFSLVGWIWLGSSAGAAEAYLVPKQGFDCFRQNIAAYEAASRDPVVIYFPVCPKVDFTAQDLQNATVDALPKPGPSILGAKKIITLTKSEMACIAAGKAVVSAAAADTVMVNLEACH